MVDLEEFGIVNTFITAVIVVSIGGAVLGAGVFDTTAAPTNTDLALTDGDGDLKSGWLDADVLNITSVESTLGDQAALTGASNSYIETTESIELASEWSVCTYATADPTVVSNNETRTVVAVDYTTLAYNGSQDVWKLWHYQESSRESSSVTIAAPDPENATLVCGYGNATHIGLSRNTTDAAPVAIQGTAPAINGSNWHGAVEETRTYAYWLSDAQQQAYVDNPIISIPGEPAQTRLMYDVRDRSTSSIPVYFGGMSATLSNADLVDGFNGPELSEGTDWKRSGSKIVALDGGVLDGDGDVVFITWIPEAFPLASTLIELGFALFFLSLFVPRLMSLT